jgi:hypothetical protein
MPNFPPIDRVHGLHTAALAKVHTSGSLWSCDTAQVVRPCSWRPQVLKHDWVVTKGGAAPRLLADGVAAGAANVAALRRLRNLAHGDCARASWPEQCRQSVKQQTDTSSHDMQGLLPLCRWGSRHLVCSATCSHRYSWDVGDGQTVCSWFST